MPAAKKTDASLPLLAESQGDMLEKSFEEQQKASASQPVECLGQTFPSDEARRQHFHKLLAEKLKDPDFRKIEGFPIGKDEDILALSDPPYYTACPNPWAADFARHYGRPYDPLDQTWRREPFATDVAEGKNDPIYNAHSYHTKVPHKAIMHYILHYTRPGDVVLDGFCGTGMTGVAAQLCADRFAVSELGYSTDSEGNVRDAEGQTISKIGTRAVIMNDLAPAATLISAGYTLTTDPAPFVQSAQKLLNQFDADYGWMHQTLDKQTKKTCPIDYTIWSEGFACPHCSHEIDFWHLAYNEDSGKIDSDLQCPGCRAELTKRDLVRRTTTFFDPITKTTRKRQVLNPVLIAYSINGQTLEKKPDDADLANIQKAEQLLSGLEYPTDAMMFSKEGEEWGDLYRGYHQGIARVDDFHLPRQLATIALLWKMGLQLPAGEAQRLWKFTLQSVMVSFTRRNRFLKNAFSQVNRGLSGTLYVGSTVSEPSPRYLLRGKLRRFTKAVPQTRQPALVTTQSLSSVQIPPESIDYIFVDPPFGDNLPYSELNFLWEAWLRVFTNAPGEAIVSGTQLKNITTYTNLMTACLRQAYTLLKPGRWLTVEFHNSKNSVWAAIQEALGVAGFIIADVRVLDKGMLTKKQLHANAVNKDLVISAYKPNAGLEQRFRLEAGAEEGVWDFARTHLTRIFHRGIEQRSGERVRRLVNTEPNETATHRFFEDRL